MYSNSYYKKYVVTKAVAVAVIVIVVVSGLLVALAQVQVIIYLKGVFSQFS